MLKSTLIVAASAAVALSAPALAQTAPSWWAPVAGERVVDLPLGAGLIQRVLYDAVRAKGPSQR